VAPGLVDTRRASTGQPAHHSLHAPLAGRLGKPEEIGALVRFLCGPEGRYITGQTIHVNGGVFMG
jgi:3-oxoacyl-[acyl-carrier protein] reductase